MKAYCVECGYELKPAPARFDGEPAIIGYLPCPNHPNTKVRYEKLGIVNNTMPEFVEEICRRISKA